MAKALLGVRHKIKRARKHLDDFEDQFKSGNEAFNATLVGVVGHPDAPRVIVDVTTCDLPHDITLPLGDAVHNLRAALDHLVCQLAIAAGNPTACEKKTQFPIFKNGAKASYSKIESISPAAQTAIKELQPFRRRPDDPEGDPLWVLSELDNIDKHRLLLVARTTFHGMACG